MSGEYIEQDVGPPSDANGLPSYDDLVVQNGPNSRFGRWRGWIEKRAAERYNDLTPDDFTRRRQRGWDLNDQSPPVPDPPHVDTSRIEQSLGGLHIQTKDLSRESSNASLNDSSSSLPPIPSISQRLAPSRLRINNFGSRFLPHSSAPIRCLLPLDSGRMLLIGHDEGLSVLDMFPQEWDSDGSIINKGPNEAHAYPIWHGESVYQMSLLESECGADGSLQGVVLFLVGPESDSCRDMDSMRSLRMYNLASLMNLGRWAISHKGEHPLDLHRPANWTAQQSPKRKSRGIAGGLRSFIDAQATAPHQDSAYSAREPASAASSPSSISSRRRPFSLRPPPPKTSPAQSETIDSWDVVDDVQLRWATDFVPLATNGSRLMNTSVLSYALWSEDAKKGRGGQLLAVVTKTNILLYETPKGERAFRFVKEFYTPMQVKKISFFHQSIQDIGPSFVDPNASNRHRRTSSSSTVRENAHFSTNSQSFGTQLSLFIVFDKKAGWIRLADSAVGEMELHDAGHSGLHHHSRSADMHNSLTAGSLLRGRMSLEAVLSTLTTKWTLPTRCLVPYPDHAGAQEVLLVTRATVTHILPYPLPVGSSPSRTPLTAIQWKSKPVFISARVLFGTESPPFLQLIAFNENGIEIQEIDLSFLAKGKGKARQLQEPIWAEEDLGGETGFLCTGGHWDRSNHTAYLGDYSPTSSISRESFTSLESDALLERISREEGIYGWCRKGPADWRVFWLGGSADIGEGDED